MTVASMVSVRQVLACVVVFTLSLQARADIAIIKNTPQQLTFAFDMRDFSITPVKIGETTVSQISFEGNNTELGIAGDRALPALSVTVGVPLSGDIVVSFAAEAVSPVPLAAPLPLLSNDNKRTAAQEPVFVDPWISQPEYFRLRDQRTAQLFLRPCRLDAQGQALIVLQKGVCTIDFPPAGIQAGPAGKDTRSAYEGMLAHLLLNYSTARAWRQPAAIPLSRVAVKAASLPVSATTATFSINDGFTETNESTTDENSLVRISGEALIDVFGTNVAIDRIALLASTARSLDSITPPPDAIPEGVVRVPVMRVDANGDGKLDKEDYILAWCTGTTEWFFDTTTRDYAIRLNRFDQNRHYWISIAGNGQEIGRFTQPPAVSGDTLDYFVNHIIYQRSKWQPSTSDDVTSWFWTSLSLTAPQFTWDLGLHHVVQDSIGKLWLAGLNYLSSGDSLKVYFGTSEPLKVADTFQIKNWTLPTLSIFYIPANVGGSYLLKSIGIRFCQNLDMSGLTKLLFFSARDSGVATYRIVNLPDETCYLMRIVPDNGPISLIDTIARGTSSYVWSDSGGRGIQYYACAKSAINSSIALAPVPRVQNSEYQVRDLRLKSNAADYCIIAPAEFVSEAVRLATHKRAIKRFESPMVVDVGDIFQQFSGGSKDPSALRNFLVYAANFWNRKPDYVLLLGNGHYDYKYYVTAEPNYIPTCEFSERCIEDFYSYLDPHEDASKNTATPDIFLGRLPGASLAETRTMIDKIIEFEGPLADFGAWRNRILLVADDDMQLSQLDPIRDQNAHHLSSEQIEKTVLLQDSAIEIRKVYLYEYPWNESYEKPAATRALINEINNGVACVNYFGHGSDNVWADEGVLKNESIGQFYNRRRYPLFTSFSCSVGRFDKPENECLSGVTVTAPNAGGIAAISSTRLAYARYNELLGKGFYRALFGDHSNLTIGQALVFSKIENKDQSQKTYCILGDPSVRFGPISDSIALETFVDAPGADQPDDTLKALQSVIIHGSLLYDGAVQTSMGTPASPAWVQIGLYNPPQDSVKRKDNGPTNVSYRLPGGPVFIGTTPITQGRFEQRILLPRRLSFDEPGVKLIAWAWSQDSSAGAAASLGKGYKGDIIFSGTDTTTVGDTIGPRIGVRAIYDKADFNNGSDYATGISGRLPFEFEVRTYDESGIDVTGVGPDEGLTIEIPNGFGKRNINNQFLFDQGDFRRGAASVTLNKGDIAPGTYLLQIGAQDLLGNGSHLQITLDIVEPTAFSLGHVFNYPNPVRLGGQTRFFFAHTATQTGGGPSQSKTDVTATIKIYSLSGRMIRVIRNAVNGQVWDGCDQRGQQLAPNVYLYRIFVQEKGSYENRDLKSPVRKLVISPP
jgi:hypothetical protein